MGAVTLLPSFFISNTRKNITLLKLETQKNQPIPDIDQEAISDIDELNNKMLLIENIGKNKFIVSEKIIDKIISLKMHDININQISYENDGAKGKIINISGVAPSRERLLLFRKALEEDKSFSKIDLPVSNFIKGSDIKFFLSLTSI